MMTKSLIIRLNELPEIIGLSTVTIWRLEKKGDFPPRKQLTGKAVGWLRSDIEEWLENRPSAIMEDEAEPVK